MKLSFQLVLVSFLSIAAALPAELGNAVSMMAPGDIKCHTSVFGKPLSLTNTPIIKDCAGFFCKATSGQKVLRGFHVTGIPALCKTMFTAPPDRETVTAEFAYFNVGGSLAGWEIKEDECKNWTDEIMNKCGAGQSGTYYTTSGQVKLWFHRFAENNKWSDEKESHS